MSEWLKSLTPEAAATYIAILAGAVGYALNSIVTWIRGRRGNRVVVSLISQSPQINISDSVRKNLEIKYNNLPIDQIVLTLLKVTNEGAITIHDMNISIDVTSNVSGQDPSRFVFVTMEVADRLEKTVGELTSDTLPTGNLNNNKWSVAIRRPFLNPRHKYPEEVVRLTIFSHGKIEIGVRGGGSGWYSQFRNASQESRETASLAAMAGVGVGLIGTAISIVALSSLGSFSVYWVVVSLVATLVTAIAAIYAIWRRLL